MPKHIVKLMVSDANNLEKGCDFNDKDAILIIRMLFFIIAIMYNKDIMFYECNVL